jgi:predicted glycosyltransferase
MPRIALYSHDTMGLGHVRRNLLLADALTAHDASSTALLVSGVHVGGAFAMPERVDCVTLPSLTKNDRDGAYGPRHLGVPLTHLQHLRARTIRTALRAFDPDLVVVDNVPRGAMGEMEPALAALKARGRTRFALGLRDVLDEPEAVAREWQRSGHHEAVDRYYDQVWIYGDRSVFDLARECRFPRTTAAKIEYVGYLDRRAVGDAPSPDYALPQAFALCTAGGGHDGATLALAFAAATGARLPRVVLAGPFMPEAARRELHRIAALDPTLRVLDFVADAARLIGRATRVVTMGGYNTVCEALAYAKHTLIVPREWPRREQLVRAERVSSRGLADVLRWTDVDAERLTEWLDRPEPLRSRAPLPFTALDRVPRLVDHLLGRRQPLSASLLRSTRLVS